MRVQYWCHSNLNEDGTVKNDPEHKLGSVRPDSQMETIGNHLLQTRSTFESGLWMYVSTSVLDSGVKHGITLFFDDESEMQKFEQSREAVGAVIENAK